MAAYLIVDITVHDASKFEEYAAAVLPIFARAGGKLIAFDESPTEIEGRWKDRVVIIEFPDKDSITRIQASPDYAPWRAHRLAISDCRSVAVAGV